MPANTRALILRFSLTDINLRRDYASLVVYQAGSLARIDLTNFFFVGHGPMPPFGTSSEILMPWDEKLEAKIVVEFQVAPRQPAYGGGAYPG